MKLTKIKNALTAKLPVFVYIFCVLQPLLDVLGYWQNEWGFSNIFTLMVRMLLLVGSVLLGFFLSDRKKYYWIAAGIVALCFCGHLFACVQAGYVRPVLDIINQARIYLMPATALCFITFLRQNDRVYTALKAGMISCLAIIGLVMLLATITGTDPHTYIDLGYGVGGWFQMPYVQSPILCIVAPFPVCWALKRWKDKVLPVVIVTLLSVAPLYFLGPRLTYAGLIVCCVGMGISLIIVDRKRMKQAVALFLCAGLFVGLYPISATVERNDSYSEYSESAEKAIEGILDEASIDEISAQTVEEMSEEEKALFLDTMRQIYVDYFTFGVMRHFGIERVAEKLNYSVDPQVLSDIRVCKVYFCQMLLEDSPTSAFFFGMDAEKMSEYVYVKDDETGEWVEELQYYDVENDIYGIFFNCGIVGLIFMLCFLLYFGFRMLLALARDFRTYFTLDLAVVGIGYCCSAMHALFTGALLRKNNSSVYLALIFAIIWYLTRKELSDKPLRLPFIRKKNEDEPS